jgi:hypothetical protein
VLDAARRRRPDGEVVAVRQSRARQFWNIEIADEPHEFALASGLRTCNSNGLPESVTDRVRRSHEQLFHFVKQPRYYSAVDEVREAHSREWGGKPNGGNTYAAMKAPGTKDANLVSAMPNPLGKLPGSVWSIPTSPLSVPAHLGVDHFAAWPPELVRRIVLGWSPREVCTACGEGRRPMMQPQNETSAERATRLGSLAAAVVPGREARSRQVQSMSHKGGHNTVQSYLLTGYACACPDTTAPSTPGVCLDPFGGTGTTALVADCFGRVGISVDLSADYCRLARWRTTDPGERARVLGVDKPPVQVDGQLGLFEGGVA